MEDVDIGWCSDGSPCYNIGWSAPGEWLAYDVQVATSGSYSFAIRAATPYSGTAMHVEVDGVNVTGALVAPNTGGWHTWVDVTSAPVSLAAGSHTLRLVADTGGYNLDYLKIAQVETTTNSPQTSIALGAYISGAPWTASKIDEYTGLVGSAPKIVMWYQDWADSWGKQFNPGGIMDAVAARGAMPMVTWEPHNGAVSGMQSNYALRTILSGTYDGYIRDWALQAKAWDKPFYLRFASEMNGNWFSWSPGVNGNTGAEYVATWRRVVDIFRQEGVTNVRWVWSPNIEYSGSTPFADVYPGDAYVDWIGVDGYNWGTSDQWHTWQTLEQVLAPSYDKLAALSNKPMMIAETASAELGGDKAEWITQGFLTTVTTRFPLVRAVVWFNERKETDWHVDSSPEALAAVREVATSPLYQGRLP